jgi:hypothetical protein
VFCNSLKISIRALEAQGTAIFYRRIKRMGGIKPPLLVFGRHLRAKNNAPRFQNPRDDGNT